MAKLSLAVAAQDFASYGFLVELLRLFVSAQIIEGDQKHDEVQAEWHLLSEQWALAHFHHVIEIEQLVVSH